MKDEELYQQYAGNMRSLEEEQEEYKRKQKVFEEERDQLYVINRSYRSDLEVLLNISGEGEDSSRMLWEIDEYVEAGSRELKKQEEELKKEYFGIRRKIADCEQWYEEEKIQIEGENEWQG